MPKSPTLAALVLILCLLTLLTGCSHSQAPIPTATGSPEALAVVNQLRSQNTQPLAISGTFTWTTTQPQAAYFAERVAMHRLPEEYYHIATTRPSDESPETIVLRHYVEDTLKDGPPQGTHTEVRRYEQRQQGQRLYVARDFTSDGKGELPSLVQTWNSRLVATWNGESGSYYYPTSQSAGRVTDYGRLLPMIWYGSPGASPAAVRFFSFGAPFPAIIGQTTLRHEQVNGEDLVVLHEDFANQYREYYLSPRDDYAPRRIIQRQKQKLKLPEQGLTGTAEYETGTWPFRHKVTWQIKTPVEPMKFLDWDHDPRDRDTTITAITRRPDGQWFVIESTTTYPFFHRTESFKAENLSFTLLPASAFEIQLPASVQVRH